MVTARRGAGRFGCLLTLLFAAAGTYFAVNVGEVYWRFYSFRDAMQQEARFAASRTDEQIRERLAQIADSLGLPEAAHRVRLRRTERAIRLSTSYYERVEFPLVARDVYFSPRAEWTF